MEQRDDRADRERQLEAEGDVNQNAEEYRGRAPRVNFFASSPPTSAPDPFLALHFELTIRDVFLDCLRDRLARVDRTANGDEAAIALDRLLDRLVIEMNRLERFTHLRDLARSWPRSAKADRRL